MNPAHLYVHAPFCARRCSYCDFAVTVDPTPSGEPWLSALAAELALLTRDERPEAGRPLRSLYVGGGTPSLMPDDAVPELIRQLGLTLDAETEWTVEANPESATPALMNRWSRAGVNRVSLGAQTFDPASLRWMGRLHRPDAVGAAVDAAKEAGIHNLSVDLIFATPESLRRSWSDDLRAVLDLDVPHVSLYGLTIEPGTALGRRRSRGEAVQADEETYRSEFLEASRVLTAAGYRHYEVSNFARRGFESVHNRAYWDGRPYLGLGNGAHSFGPPVRRWNVRDWEEYRSLVFSGRRPEAEREWVEGGQRRLERVWLALRTDEGLPLDLERMGPAASALVGRWLRSGWLRATDAGRMERLVLNEEGWLLLDRLAVEWADVLDTATAREEV